MHSDDTYDFYDDDFDIEFEDNNQDEETLSADRCDSIGLDARRKVEMLRERASLRRQISDLDLDFAA